MVAEGMFKWLAKLLAMVVIFSSCCYLVLLAINWQDQPASPASVKMQHILQQRAQVAEQDNGFVHYQRQQHRLPAFSAEFLKLYQHCQRATCATVLNDAQGEIPELLLQHQPQLEFYQQLLKFPAWQAPTITDATTIPAYSVLTRMQWLQMLHVWHALSQGQTDVARTLLQQDFTFLRRLLISNSQLIDKMLTVAVIKQHLYFANSLHQTLMAEQYQQVMPNSWQVPFTADELSMLPVFAGEWSFGNNLLLQSIEQTKNDDIPVVEKWLVAVLAKPFFQSQDTSNALARNYLRCTAQISSQTVEKPAHNGLQWLYNPVGKLIISANMDYCRNYTEQVLELEQLRRHLFSGAL